MLDAACLGRSRGPQRPHLHFPFGPAERNRIDDRPRLVAREANVLRANASDALALERAFLYRDWALAVDLPRAGCVNRFAVHLHPGADPLEDPQFLAVDRAIRSPGDVENERAVLAHRIDEPVDRIA